MPFPEIVKNLALKYAHHRCECQRKKCPHPKDNRGRCTKTNSLEVHHRIKDSLGGPDILANAQVLCEECHKFIHS